MSDEQEQQTRTSKSSSLYEDLSLADLVQYLSRLANLNGLPSTGNPSLSQALRQLANALRPHANRPLQEIIALLKEPVPTKQTTRTPKSVKLALPNDLHVLTRQQVEDILRNEDFTKLQLIELGVARLGISQSRLTRLGKIEVVEAVRAALDHENSLGIISEEARRGGAKRTS